MTNPIEALERLAKLKADGLLTDDEFVRQKAIILGTPITAPEPTIATPTEASHEAEPDYAAIRRGKFPPGTTAADRRRLTKASWNDGSAAARGLKVLMIAAPICFILTLNYCRNQTRDVEPASDELSEFTPVADPYQVPIIIEYEKANSECRDGPDADSAACQRRNELLPLIAQAGFCWGNGAEQSEAETRWVRCQAAAQ